MVRIHECAGQVAPPQTHYKMRGNQRFQSANRRQTSLASGICGIASRWPIDICSHRRPKLSLLNTATLLPLLLVAAHYGLVLAAVYGSGCCAAAAAATRQRGRRALRALLRGRPLLRRHCVRRDRRLCRHVIRSDTQGCWHLLRRKANCRGKQQHGNDNDLLHSAPPFAFVATATPTRMTHPPAASSHVTCSPRNTVANATPTSGVR